MRKPHTHNVPITLEGLNQKLDFEIKRLIREKEEGIASYVSKAPILNGISKVIFKKVNGAKITFSYRLDAGGALRFAPEKQFTDLVLDKKASDRPSVGRTSVDI